MTAPKEKMSTEERARRIREGKERAAAERAAAAEAQQHAVAQETKQDTIAGELPQTPTVTPAPPADALGQELLPGVVKAYEPSTKSEQQKDIEHAQALREAQAADAEAATQFPAIGDANPDVVLHVLEDGFTVLGKVWYRGELIRLTYGSDRWKLTQDSSGKSWTEMGPEEQFVRYGKQMFGRGDWPYPVTSDEANEEAYRQAIASGDHEAIRRYEKQQQRATHPKVPTSP